MGGIELGNYVCIYK